LPVSQNRPRFDARSKQPGRTASHPIPPPDFRIGKSQQKYVDQFDPVRLNVPMPA
jgi:hypothetical protein